jgi:hypothetical protein
MADLLNATTVRDRSFVFLGATHGFIDKRGDCNEKAT